MDFTLACSSRNTAVSLFIEILVISPPPPERQVKFYPLKQKTMRKTIHGAIAPAPPQSSVGPIELENFREMGLQNWSYCSKP